MSALDILCHGIEAYTSVKKNPVSDAYAFSAIKLTAESLPVIVKNAGIKGKKQLVKWGTVIRYGLFKFQRRNFARYCKRAYRILQSTPYRSCFSNTSILSGA